MKALVSFATALALTLAAQTPNLDVIRLKNGPCGMTGTAKSPEGKALDRDKNRYVAPKAGDIDSTVSLAAMLAPGDDVSRFSQKKAARIVGYVLDVKEGGNETCNCKNTDIDSRDTHIELALAKNAPERQRVIVEVTPRLRKLMHDASPSVDWRTNTLMSPAHGIKGKWVEVTGWMLFDAVHINEAENTNPDNRKNWRATAWEIHPITSMRVLPHAPAVAELAPAMFAAFQAAHAEHVDRDPATRKALRERNEQIIAKFAPEEREDELP